MSDADYRRAVGQRLRAVIDALGIPYVQAAAEMGVTKNHLGNWMRGQAYPRLYELYRFCRIRGVNTDFILLDDPSGLPGKVLSKMLLGPQRQEDPGEPETPGNENASDGKALAKAR